MGLLSCQPLPSSSVLLQALTSISAKRTTSTLSRRMSLTWTSAAASGPFGTGAVLPSLPFISPLLCPSMVALACNMELGAVGGKGLLSSWGRGSGWSACYRLTGNRAKTQGLCPGKLGRVAGGAMLWSVTVGHAGLFVLQNSSRIPRGMTNHQGMPCGHASAVGHRLLPYTSCMNYNNGYTINRTDSICVHLLAQRKGEDDVQLPAGFLADTENVT